MGLGEAPQAPRKNLEITHTVGDAFTSVTDNFSAFAKIAAVPGLLYILVGLSPFLPLLLWQAGSPASASVLSAYVEVATILISWFAGIYFAVAWHRFLLLGETGGRPQVISAWRGPHWRFLFYAILFVVVPWLIAFVVSVTLIAPGIGRGLNLGWPGVILVLAAVGVGAWLWLRVSLVFPGAAVGAEGYGFKQAWADTRGNAGRLIVVLLLVYVPVAIVLWIVSFLAADIFITPNGVVGGVATFILSAVVVLAIQIWLMGVTVSIFSSAFRQLASWAAPASPASAATQAGGFAG